MFLNQMLRRFTFRIKAGLTILALLVLISSAGATTLIMNYNGVKPPESINEIEVDISADKYTCYLYDHIKIIMKAKNTGDRILKNVSLEWRADTPSITPEGGGSNPKDLAPGEERTEIFEVVAESAPDDSMIEGWALFWDDGTQVYAGSFIILILEEPITPIPEFPDSSSVLSVATVMLLALFLLIQNRKSK